MYIQGEDVTKLASMAKLKVGRLARELSDACLQYWGGMGFTNEVLVSRLYRLVQRECDLVTRFYQSVQRDCDLVTRLYRSEQRGCDLVTKLYQSVLWGVSL